MHFQGTIVGLMFTVTLTGAALPSSTEPRPANHAPSVSERVARDIAWSFGIVRIDEIALAGARWEIAGHDQDGNERQIDISAYDGRILN